MTYAYIDELKKFLLQQEASPLTHRSYIADTKEFQKFIGKTPMKVERDDIDNFMLHLREKGLQPQTICRKVTSLSTFFKALRYFKLTEINPTQDLVKPKIRKKKTKALTKVQIDALRDYPAESFAEKLDRLVIELFFSTGARRADLATAKLVDYNQTDSTIRVIGKGNKEAYLMLTQKAQAMLDEYLACLSKPEKPRECLLVNAEDVCLGRNGVYESVKRVAEKALAGVRVYPHLLRHTAITLRYEAGQDIRSLKDFARHESIATTDGYVSTNLAKQRIEHTKYDPDATKP